MAFDLKGFSDSILRLNIILFFPSLISGILATISYFTPKQNDFKNDHVALNGIILKKRAYALTKFIASVEFIPTSIMEVKDIDGEDFFLQLDKYYQHKNDLIKLERNFYKCQFQLRIVFFLSLMFLILSFFHPALKILSFLSGLVLIILACWRTQNLATIGKKIHDLKINPDLLK